MAKRRTKAQKKKARISYQLPTKQIDAVEPAAQKVKLVRVKDDSTLLMSYDTRLLKNDLIKTLIISVIILGLELALYYRFVM